MCSSRLLRLGGEDGEAGCDDHQADTERESVVFGHGFDDGTGDDAEHGDEASDEFAVHLEASAAVLVAGGDGVHVDDAVDPEPARRHLHGDASAVAVGDVEAILDVAEPDGDGAGTDESARTADAAARECRDGSSSGCLGAGVVAPDEGAEQPRELGVPVPRAGVDPAGAAGGDPPGRARDHLGPHGDLGCVAVATSDDGQAVRRRVVGDGARVRACLADHRADARIDPLGCPRVRHHRGAEQCECDGEDHRTK